MTAQHMPGPWKVGYKAHDVLAPSKRGGDTKVCDIRAWGYLTGKGDGALGLADEEAYAIQQANARLIAAAPELLNLSKQLTSFLSDAEAIDFNDAEVRAWIVLVRTKALAIIAKAEGRP